jgi:prolyl oligopeptidase
VQAEKRLMKVFWIVGILALAAACSQHILAAERVGTQARAGALSATDGTHQERTQVKAAPSPEGDPLAWLEDPRGDRALRWVRAQNQRTLEVLKADPRFSRYYAAALQAAADEGRLAISKGRGGRIVNGWVHNLMNDDAHPLGLWRRATLQSFMSADPQWEVLLDLDQLSAAEGRRWGFSFAQLTCLPARPERCLIWLTDGWRAEGMFREFDLGTRSFVAGGFNVPEAITRVFWWDKDTVLIATNALAREHSNGEAVQFTAAKAPMEVRLWKRGQPLEEAKIIFRGGPQTAVVWPEQYADASGKSINVVNSFDWQGRISSWLLDGQGGMQPMALPPKVRSRTLHRGQCIVLLSEQWTVAGKTYPEGALVSVSLDSMAAAAPTVRVLKIPDPREAIFDVQATRAAVLVSSFYNVKGRLERFQFEKGQWQRDAVALPDHGSIDIAMADSTSETALVTYQDFLQPTTFYTADTVTARVRPLRSDASSPGANRFVTEQFEATSSDGARVPYFLVRDRDLKYDGGSPTLMTGYGGFGLPQYPTYSAAVHRLWLEQGGTYVLANIRGGGEFGPAWHKAAIKVNRQRAYDDFIAVAEDLIRRKITSPRRLGIKGFSNGGLLVGVMLNQRPELFHAAVAMVPALDLLRLDLLRGGVQAAREFGSLEIPEERAFIERTSPYQNLRARPDFPAPLLITATNDDNVHPAHARKYAARVQELGMQVYYYESEEGGHGASLTAAGRAQNEAIEFVYLARALAD